MPGRTQRFKVRDGASRATRPSGCNIVVGRGDGEREREGAPLTRPALRPDLAAVRLDELAHDVEPEPQPLPLAPLAAVVAVEDARQVVVPDPRSAIGDGDAHR